MTSPAAPADVTGSGGGGGLTVLLARRGGRPGGSELSVAQLVSEESDGVGLWRRVETTVRGVVATEAVSESTDIESRPSWRRARDRVMRG